MLSRIPVKGYMYWGLMDSYERQKSTQLTVLAGRR